MRHVLVGVTKADDHVSNHDAPASGTERNGKTFHCKRYSQSIHLSIELSSALSAGE